MTGPVHGTISSLRAPERALLVGRKDGNLPARQQRLMELEYLPFPIEDATAALTKLRSERFSLVVLDVDTQGMTAQEFLEALRADPKLGSKPVLVVSATDAQAALDAAVAAGADGWIPAVCDAETLKGRIDAALRRRAR